MEQIVDYTQMSETKAISMIEFENQVFELVDEDEMGNKEIYHFDKKYGIRRIK